MAFATINKGASYFNTITYTGDGSSPRSLTGVGFKPDLAWIKCRSQAGSNGWYDAVRGAGASNNLSTDSTTVPGGDGAGYGYLSAFNTDGVSVTAGTVGSDIVNKSSATYVDWNWLAANSTTSNTSGTITATISANQTSGFSVGKTTGTLSSGTITVGHGLGVAPDMVIWKRSDGTSNWQVYHKSTGTGLMQLNNTGGVNTGSSYWPATSSTTFSVANALYGAGETYAFYCFAGIKGYSKFGSYTGNASGTNGPFIYTGFKPAFVMVKQYSGGGSQSWVLLDNKRNTYNPENKYIYADTNGTEGTETAGDFLSNGFKINSIYGFVNESGGSYLYMAFAENPFVLTDGTPVTAR